MQIVTASPLSALLLSKGKIKAMSYMGAEAARCTTPLRFGLLRVWRRSSSRHTWRTWILDFARGSGDGRQYLRRNRTSRTITGQRSRGSEPIVTGACRQQRTARCQGGPDGCATRDGGRRAHGSTGARGLGQHSPCETPRRPVRGAQRTDRRAVGLGDPSRTGVAAREPAFDEAGPGHHARCSRKPCPAPPSAKRESPRDGMVR